MADKLRIDIWSDIACPWCYVGKRRLEAALARFPHRDRVEIVWRAFELDPSAPRQHDSSMSQTERLAAKYDVTVKQAETMNARLAETARDDGLDFRFDRIRTGNMFDAHRVLHLALDQGLGVQDRVKERLLLAYMTEGATLGEPETLVRLAAEAGLDAGDVRAMLASDRYGREVRQDEEEARELGIIGVPFFVLGGRYAISGAQPAELFLRALEQAWRELAGRPAVLAEGAVCGPDGCA